MKKKPKGWRGRSEVQKLTHINNHCLNFFATARPCFMWKGILFPNLHRGSTFQWSDFFFICQVASNFLRNCNPVRHVAFPRARRGFAGFFPVQLLRAQTKRRLVGRSVGVVCLSSYLPLEDGDQHQQQRRQVEKWVNEKKSMLVKREKWWGKRGEGFRCLFFGKNLSSINNHFVYSELVLEAFDGVEKKK